MARPLVLIYQEFASITVTPDTPDLNCLVAGPAYWIKDYLDDKGDIQSASNYGTLNAANPYTPPAAFTDAITIAEPPGNKTGALLEANSVTIYFDECRVAISEDVTTGGDVTENINVLTGAGGTTFVTDGVSAGDYLVIDEPGGAGTIVKRILAVDSETVLRTTTNFVATDTGLKYRIEREVVDVAIDSSFVVISGNEIVVQGGATTVLTGETVARTINFAKAYVEYMSLRQDLRSVDTVSSETEVLSKIGKNDARNPLAGVVNTALQNTTTPIQFFGVPSDNLTGHNECIEILGGRKDIYAILPITVEKTILAAYKTDVEGLASVTQAEQTGIPQKFRVVIGAQALPTTAVVSGPYTGQGAHGSVTGAIAGTPITSADAINIFADTAATFVTAGIRAGDTLVIVSDTAGVTRVGSYTVAEVYDETRLRTTTAFPSADNIGSVVYYIIRGTGTPVASTSFTLGDCTAISNRITAPLVTGLASHVGAVVRLTAPAGNVGDWLVTAMSAAGPPAQWVVAPVSTLVDNTGGTTGQLFDTLYANTAGVVVATRRPFRVITDNTATFTTDLVKATDALEVPNPLTGTDYTTLAPYSYIVAYIPNENVVVLTANTDVIAQNVETGDTTLNFRINRALTKDDMVDELSIISQSFNSRRVILVWPDSVDVAGLVDGSKARTNGVIANADAQPGYYLAAAVGGMTAGLPSHQGFTNLGIAGIDQLYHSTRYFSDRQLTEISDAGWFVFEQESPNALPVCIHQLTTDPNTLETGEYSVVKNFDFVALFFQDILSEFIGSYNVNDETMGYLRQAMVTGIDLLKLRKYSKIGAPLNDAAITSLAVSPAAADRVEAYMTVVLPKPLNRIGLHLISS